MDEKQLQALHDAMSKQLGLGDYESFKKQLISDDKFRKAFYDEASHELDLGDYKTFDESVKKKPSSNGGATISEVGLSNIPQANSIEQPIVPQKNPIDLATDYNDLSNAKKEISIGAGGVAMGTGSAEVPDEEKTKAAQDLRDKTLKESGIDLHDLANETKGLTANDFGKEGFSKEELLNDRQTNNELYHRKLNSLKWKSGLDNELANKLVNGDISKDVYDGLKHNIDISLQNAGTGGFEQQRQNINSVANTIKEYGGDKKDELLNNYAVEAAKVYGNSWKSGGVKAPEGTPESKYLTNPNAELGYQYLKDISPDKAAQYERLFIDPKSIKDDPDAQKGYNHLMQTLEETGVALQDNAVKEDLNNLVNISKVNGGLTPEQLEQAKKLKAKQDELTKAKAELDTKYPDRIENKVDDAMTEILGQKLGWGMYAGGMAGKAFKNTGEGIWEMVSEPFMSDQSNTIRELALMGESKFDEDLYKKSDANKGLQTETLVIAPELQAKIDAIKNNKSLTDEQKQQQLYPLLKSNTDKFGRVPIEGGKMNISPSSILYGLTDLGTTLLPFLALETATGGIGVASTAAKFLKTFTAAAATGFHDEYANAVNRGLGQADAFKEALGITAINSAAMAGAGTGEKVKALFAGGKSSAAKIIESMSEDAIDKILAKGTPKGLKALKESLTGRIKQVPEQFAKGLKTGATFEAAMTGAKEAQHQLYGTPIDREQNFKQSLLNIANFGLAGVIGGQAGYKSPTELQKSNLIEFGKNPTGFLATAEKMKRDGQLTQQEFDHRKDLIEKSGTAYKALPKSNAKGKSLSEKEKGEYLYNTVIKNEAKTKAKDLPPSQAEKSLHISMVADYKNDIILENPTDKQLEIRKNTLQKQLENKDEEGKPLLNDTEIAKVKAQIDAVNETIEQRAKWISVQPPMNVPEPVTIGGEKTEPSKEVFIPIEEKSDADIEKRMAAIEGNSEHQSEFNSLEKEMERRERDSVFGVPLEKVNDAVDTLMKKEKEMPNGYGSFIEKRDARETKEVADKYLKASDLTDAELKKDFSDAVRGNPTTWYADGLKMREALKEATKRGIDTEKMLEAVTKVYTDAGYDIQTAKSVVANMLKPVFEGSKKVETNESKLLSENKPINEEAQPTEIPKSETQAGTTVEEPNKNIPTAEEGTGGGEPPQEPIEPINVEDDLGNIGRRFTQQMLRTEDLTPEAKAGIQKTLEYAEQTNAMSAQEAADVLNKVGVDEAFNLITDRNSNMNGGVRVTLAQAIIKNYNELAKNAPDEATKNYYLDKTISAATFVTEKLATDAGQSIQAFSMWERLSPEAQLRAAVKDVKNQSKGKKAKVTKDVDKVGNAMQKANEETVDEITKPENLKKQAEKLQSKLAKKGQDKIAKAKAAREKFIKKYKSDKGKNLYAGVGLTNEGIEFVGNVIKTYIDEGIGKLEIVTDKVLQHLKDISGKVPNSEVIKNVNDIAKDLLQKASDIKIAKGLKELEKEVSDIVRKHYTIKEDAKTDLTTKFMDKLGLEKDEAEQLAKEIKSEFDNIATRKKQDILDREIRRLNKIKNNLQGSKPVERKQVQDEIIKYSNLGAFDNGKLIDVIGDKLGLGELSKDEANKIIELSNKIQNAPEGAPKRNATEELLKYRANLKGTNWGEVAQGVWYANVLSGYATHIRNIVSTFYNTMSFFGVEAASNPKTIPYLMLGMGKGFYKGVVEATHTVKTGQTPIHIAKVEVPDILERTRFKGGLLNPANWLKYVGRLMKAEDVLLFQGLKEMRATQLALREANQAGFKNPFSKATYDKVNELLLNTKERLESATTQADSEGFKGIEKQRRVFELMEMSRPIQMTEQAYGFAAKGTFNHNTEGTLGAISDAISGFLDNSLEIGGTKPLRFLVPFTRIITNVANNSLDFSPVGLIRGIRGKRGLFASEASQKRVEMTPEERRQTIVKASLGIAAMGTLYALARNGQVDVSGAGPSDIKKRLQLIQQGWQPFSIKIGDTYYSYKLTPLVFGFGLVGSIRDHEQYDKDADEQTLGNRVALTTWDGIGLISDMTWVGSAAPLMGAMQEKNPQTAGKILSNIAKNSAKSFLVPNIYTQAAQKIEQVWNIPQKEANNFGQLLIKDVPIARNHLFDRINALGDPVTKDVDVLKSTLTKDPVWKYLFEKKGWIAPVNKNTLIIYDNKTGEDRPATDEDFYNFSKLRGQKIKSQIEDYINGKTELISSEDFESRSPSKVTSKELNTWLSKIATQATKDAKMELFGQSEEPKAPKLKMIAIPK